MKRERSLHSDTIGIPFRMFKYIFSVLIVVVMFSSCRIIRPYHTPDLFHVDLYRDDVPSDSQTLAALSWRELFRDTVLQRLIGEGIANNLDLQTAYARIDEAWAYYRQSRAAFWPTLSGDINYTYARLSEVQGFGIRTRASQFQVQVLSDWEIDLWGALRSNRRANLANLLRSEAAARTVQAQLVATIATFYFSFLHLTNSLSSPSRP
jgi:Outer membrane protein